MRRTWWLIPCLIVVLGLGIVGCAPQTNAPAVEQQNTGIWVTGQGEAMAVPDMVMLSLGIEVQADTLGEAQAQASETMNEVMQALQANNVSQKDIQTQQFSIYPVRSWNRDSDEEEIVGYRVTNIVLVKIREVNNTGAIIDAVAEAGGDFTRIQDISFTVDNPTPYYEVARAEAMDDAKGKATQLATSAGVQLGKPTYISEGAVYVPRYILGGVGGESFNPETPISPGELKITVNVQVVYGII